MNYNILKASSLNKLIELVNEEIKHNYKPQGGVCLSPNQLDIKIGRHGDKVSSYIFIQAMVKDEI